MHNSHKLLLAGFSVEEIESEPLHTFTTRGSGEVVFYKTFATYRAQLKKIYFAVRYSTISGKKNVDFSEFRVEIDGNIDLAANYLTEHFQRVMENDESVVILQNE